MPRRRCSRSSTPTCSRAQAARAARASASGCRRRCARMPGVQRLCPSDANMILVRVPDAAARLRGHEGARRAGQERFRMHPLLADCLRLTVGTPDENTQTARGPAPASLAYDHRPRTAEVTPQHQRRRRSASRVDLDGTGAAKLATGIGFLDHMLDQIARHGLIDLDDRGQGRPAHRRPPHGRGHRHHARPGGRQGGRRQEGHPPLRPRLRAARRGAVARGDRLLRPARAWNDTCRSSAA